MSSLGRVTIADFGSVLAAAPAKQRTNMVHVVSQATTQGTTTHLAAMKLEERVA